MLICLVLPHSKYYDEIILPGVYFVNDVIKYCVGLLVAVEVNKRIPVITRIFPSDMKVNVAVACDLPQVNILRTYICITT